MKIESRMVNLFLSRINKSDSCWNWTGSKFITGYGYLYGINRTKVYAHRFSYFYFNNALDEKLVVDHLCNNRLCVNPEHLKLCSHKININRGNAPNILVKKERLRTSVCKNGHDKEMWNDKRRKCYLCELTYKRKIYNSKRQRS